MILRSVFDGSTVAYRCNDLLVKNQNSNFLSCLRVSKTFASRNEIIDAMLEVSQINVKNETDLRSLLEFLNPIHRPHVRRIQFSNLLSAVPTRGGKAMLFGDLRSALPGIEHIGLGFWDNGIKYKDSGHYPELNASHESAISTTAYQYAGHRGHISRHDPIRLLCGSRWNPCALEESRGVLDVEMEYSRNMMNRVHVEKIIADRFASHRQVSLLERWKLGLLVDAAGSGVTIGFSWLLNFRCHNVVRPLIYRFSFRFDTGMMCLCSRFRGLDIKIPQVFPEWFRNEYGTTKACRAS